MLEVENNAPTNTLPPTTDKPQIVGRVKYPLCETINQSQYFEDTDCDEIVSTTIKSCMTNVYASIEMETELTTPKPISQLLQSKLATQLKLLEKSIKATDRRLDPRLQRSKPLKEAITLDANILNYGQFLTGKVMGCTLIITNHNSQTENITIEFDNSMFYTSRQIGDEFPKISTNNKENVVNSEEVHKCWILENPDTKKLEKVLNVKLEPKGFTEVMVILKSPMLKSTQHLYNMLLVRRQCDIYSPNTTGPTGIWSSKFIRVCLHGIVEVPILTCPRRIVANNISTIPLAVKKTVGTQRYRIPFKNESKLDLELELSFLKIEHVLGIDYFCIPNIMKIGAGTTGILSVLIKNIHASDTSSATEDTTYKSDGNIIKDPRMLVAKIKNSQIFFSFYIDAILY
jgi:hypothetical protein